MALSYIAIALILIQIIFGILFFVLFLFALIQLIRSAKIKKDADEKLIKKIENKSLISTLYYGLLALLCLAQSTLMELLAYEAVFDYDRLVESDKGNSTVNKIFTNGNYVPDSIFFIIFCLIFSQMVLYNSHAHLRQGNLLRDQQTIAIARTFNVPNNLKILLFGYLFIQFLIIMLYNISAVDSKILNYIDLFFNASLPLNLVIYFCYKFKKFAGSPISTEKAEKNIHRLEIILIYFSIGRVIQCIFNVFMANNSVFILDILQTQSTDLTKTTSTAMLIELGSIALNLLACQIIPFGISLQNTYVKILSKTFSEQKLLLLDDEQIDPMQNEIAMVSNESLASQKGDSKEDYLFDRPRLSVTDYKDRTIIQININEVQFKETQYQQESISQVQLGTLCLANLKSGKYKDKQFMVRTLQVKRLSQYLIEEINKNIQEYRNLSHRYIQPIKAISLDNENVYFFTPYFNNGNLYQVINSVNLVDDVIKRKILLQICEGMAYLHAQSPKISHGHLIPNNVMMGKNNDVKLVDFGLSAMKKYVALTTGYTTKSQYSSPEQINERSLTPSYIESADVYAFGVITWEIYHQKQAFKGVSQADLKQKIGEEKKRPKIDDNIDNQIAQIIRACWQDDQQKRPNFETLIKTLNGEEKMPITPREV